MCASRRELVGTSLVPAHVRALLRVQNGYTALMWAAYHGSAECVAALLAVGRIDVNVQNEVCPTIVHHTCQASAHCGLSADWGHSNPLTFVR